MIVLPVMVATGIDHRGIMAGKSDVLCQHVGGGRDLGILTERADGGHYTERLLVTASLHILRHLEHLSSQLCSDPTRGLRDLQTTEDVSPSIAESLALLQRDARSKPVPVLADERHIFEHDLLPGEQARGLPRRESLVRAGDGRFELLVCRLGHSCDEVVRGGIVQVDPLGGLGLDELVVEEVLCIYGLDLVVCGRIGCGGRDGLRQLPGCSV